MGRWFPLSIGFMEDPKFRLLSPSEKLYYWRLVSEFNLRGEFYQSDLEMAKTLGTCEKTIRRGRSKLTEMGLINAIPGTRTRRNQMLATQYPFIRYANLDEEGFFAQIRRYTFNVMLHYLRKASLQSGDIVVYIYLSYWFWRNRGKNEDHRFFITKERLQSLTNLKDAPIRIPRIYEAFVFSDGTHLFNYQDEYRRFTFRDWNICAEPKNDEQSRGNAERYIKEIKDLVAREKRDRELKLQQKTVNLPKNSNDHFPSPLGVFYELYMKRYARMPNSRGDNRLIELGKTFGRGVISQAINWYFTADTVPNGSGAKTRTLGNFIAHIDDILKLSTQSAFV